MITSPKDTGISDVVVPGTTCDKVPGKSIGPVVTQKGSGLNDGPYVHTGVEVAAFRGTNNPDSEGVYMVR